MPSLDSLIQQTLDTAANKGAQMKNYRDMMLRDATDKWRAELEGRANVARMGEEGAIKRADMQYGLGGASDRTNAAHLSATDLTAGVTRRGQDIAADQHAIEMFKGQRLRDAQTTEAEARAKGLDPSSPHFKMEELGKRTAFYNSLIQAGESHESAYTKAGLSAFEDKQTGGSGAPGRGPQTQRQLADKMVAGMSAPKGNWGQGSSEDNWEGQAQGRPGASDPRIVPIISALRGKGWNAENTSKYMMEKFPQAGLTPDIVKSLGKVQGGELQDPSWYVDPVNLAGGLGTVPAKWAGKSATRAVTNKAANWNNSLSGDLQSYYKGAF
jgi:hypothetical protein